MKKLEIGQRFDVVEIRTNGGYSINNIFKIGGHSVMYSDRQCLINGESGLFKGKNQSLCMLENDVKLIGCLIVKKVK